MSETVTDVDFRYYVQSAHLFANLQECSAGYWLCIDHVVNVVLILLSCLTTGEIISGTIFSHIILIVISTSLTFFNGFKIYMNPSVKAEAHTQCAKKMEQTKLALNNCDTLSEYKHIINYFHNDLGSAPGLVFFLRRHWIGRQERLSISVNMRKFIVKSDREDTGVTLRSQPCLPCCRVNSTIEVVTEGGLSEEEEEEDEGQKH
jgi:hypothetical protein